MNQSSCGGWRGRQGFGKSRSARSACKAAQDEGGNTYSSNCMALRASFGSLHPDLSQPHLGLLAQKATEYLCHISKSPRAQAPYVLLNAHKRTWLIQETSSMSRSRGAGQSCGPRLAVLGWAIIRNSAFNSRNFILLQRKSPKRQPSTPGGEGASPTCTEVWKSWIPANFS